MKLDVQKIIDSVKEMIEEGNVPRNKEMVIEEKDLSS